MKRSFAMILLLCLLLSPAAWATESEILLSTATEKTDFLGISSVACLENTIYALTYDALYTLDESGDSTRWKLDTATLIPQGAGDGFFSPLALLIFDGAPHALASRLLYSADRGEIDLYELGLYALRLEEAAQAVEFELTLPLETDDWVSYDNGQANLEFPAQRFFSTGDSLYGVPRFLGAGESLLRFSLTDGTLETIATPQGASQILPYREGKLLVQMGNPAMLQDMSLAEWSPDTGDVQTLCSLPAKWEEAPGYLYFHAAENAVYLAYDGELYRMQDMDADNLTVLGFSSVRLAETTPVLADGNALVVADAQTLAKIPLDSSAQEREQLVVCGLWLDDARLAFLASHPEIDVVTREEGGIDVAQALSTRDASIDVYALPVESADYEAAFSRGYMVSLSQSETLSGLVASLYPHLREAVAKDGVPLAVPVFVQINSNAPSYDPIAFESVGLSQEDVPTTWLEFLRLVARLPEILQEFADISAFDPNMNAQTARAFLLSSVLDAYWEVSAQPGNAQKLDTPLFRQLMEAFEAIDFAGLNATGTVGEATSAPFVEHRVLFPTLSGNRIAPAGNTEYALFLSLREGMEPVFLTHLTAAFVNPYSQNTQAAIAFLETAVNALDSEQRICLLPEENAPVPNPQYETELARLDGQIAAMQAQSPETDEERLRLEQELAAARKQRERYAQENQFSLSTEDIAAFRALDSHFVLARHRFGLESSLSSAFYPQIALYTQGEWDLERLIAEIDQRLAMAQMEG